MQEQQADTATDTDVDNELSPAEIEANKKEAEKLGLARNQKVFEEAMKLQQRLKVATDAQDKAEIKKVSEEIQTFMKKHAPPPYRSGEFDPDFMRLYQKEPFLGGVSAGVSKVVTTEMPTAFVGVRANGKSHEAILGLNPVFFRGCTEKQRLGVLRHEIYHLIFSAHLLLAPSESTAIRCFGTGQPTWQSTASLVLKICQEWSFARGKNQSIPRQGSRSTTLMGSLSKTLRNWSLPIGIFEELRKIQEKLGDKDSSIAIGFWHRNLGRSQQLGRRSGRSSGTSQRQSSRND